ncbi:hypothetical protein SAMD00023353_4700810 [Rosellinia necatrix]|uniref:Uncharacterized protein n=1 Tax=Rosellinia necatrix TaxID=77044 RepID=A0A1W2TQT0_ROSNE|nr:hypothetical protein SAMD00023353_4700810 [Rosellinia necatrix]
MRPEAAMSTQSSLSSRAGSPANIKPGLDEEVLPSGRCRYILLNPEIKGQRCACVGFTLNRSQPGVFCLCGHLSCYHVKSTETPPDKTEVEELRRRIQMLEGQLDRDSQTSIGNALGQLVKRLGDLEEQFETSRDEISQEMKDCYGNVSRMWVSFDQLDRRQTTSENKTISYDERLDGHDDTLQRLNDRIVEVDEAAMAMEERVEVLEDRQLPSRPHHRHQRQPTYESERDRRWLSQYGGTLRAQPLLNSNQGAAHVPSESVTYTQTRVPWTVHVSLLPTKTQPFPFEKDTNAYKRCLSRGLHQMVAVGGTDSDSFNQAIAKAFKGLLHGREWMPLQARLCDAVTLEGLPMLRPLDSSLLGRPYDLDFLRQYCAVCHPTGKVESLYIAMVHDTFSWHFLRRSPCHLDGLETSWEYDQLLDRDDNWDDDTGGEQDRPPAGDIIPPLPSLKRTASEISRAPSFSAAEGDGSRPKLARMQVEACRQGVETI